MPTVETGDRTACEIGLQKTVSGATNASPIVITTTTAHLFSTGNLVDVEGVLGNTAANGSWYVTVIDSTHFSLDGSTGSGAYVSGGVATNRSMTPAFNIPSDGDPRNAASVSVPLEALANRTQLLAILSYMRKKTFPVNATWNAPADCLPFGIVVGCGGGGGGASGSKEGVSATNHCNPGGGGGGGAEEIITFVEFHAGEAYAIAVGAGGTGGASGSGGQNGTDGGDSTVTRNSTATVIAKMLGAGKGYCGTVNTVANTTAQLQLGGNANRLNQIGSSTRIVTSSSFFFADRPIGRWQSCGGYGHGWGASYSTNFGDGAPSRQGYAGGTRVAGALASNSGSYQAGGVGGGGGAGPYGVGGNGGNGGNASGGTTGSNGQAGTAAAANTGAGGGGGGGGGQGFLGDGTEGAGANGGSGLVTIYYFGSPT